MWNRINKISKTSVVILTIISCFIPAKNFACADSISVQKKVSHPLHLYYSKPQIDVNLVIAYMDSIGIKHPEVVIKQALLETGHFRSRLLIDRNNLFAFRFSKHYMRFKDWRNSVEYYKKWQDKFYTNPDEDYYLFLQRVKYARTKKYIKVLKQVKIQSR
jgi:hypothetical protein